MLKYDKLTDDEYEALILLDAELRRIQKIHKHDILWTFQPNFNYVKAELPESAYLALNEAKESAPKEIPVREFQLKRWAV